MHHARRLITSAASGLALTLATTVPAAAMDDVTLEPFLVAEDPAGDLMDTGGAKADVDAARGLDVLRVRHRLNGNRLILVSRHKNLTRANTNVNPDKTPVGGSFTMFAAYVEAKPNSGNGYTVYFERDRKVAITELNNPGVLVPCPIAAERSRLDLDLDIARYVVPLSCIENVSATRSMAQAIRYKVDRRRADGVEVIEMVTLDMNDRYVPRLALR